MRSLLLAAGLACGLLALACASGGNGGHPLVGQAAPDFGGTWLNHPDTTLSALAGKVVLVEVWRTW